MKKITAFLLILITSICFVGCNKKSKDYSREDVYKYIESNIKAEYLQKYYSDSNFISGSDDFLSELVKEDSKYNKIYTVYQPLVRNSIQFVVNYYSWLNSVPAYSDSDNGETKIISQTKLNSLYSSAEDFFSMASSFENTLSSFEVYTNGYTVDDTGYIANYRYESFEKEFAKLVASSVNFTDNLSQIYFENYFGEFNFGEIVLDEDFLPMFNVYNNYTKFLEARLVYNINIQPYGVLNTEYSQILNIYQPKRIDGIYQKFEYPTENDYLDFLTVKNKTMTKHFTDLISEWLLVASDIKNCQSTLIECVQNIYGNKKTSDQAKKQYKEIMEDLISNEYLELFKINDDIYYWINYVPSSVV